MVAVTGIEPGFSAAADGGLALCATFPPPLQDLWAIPAVSSAELLVFDRLRLVVSSAQAICPGAGGNPSFLGSTSGGGFCGLLGFGGVTRAGAWGTLKVPSPGGPLLCLRFGHATHVCPRSSQWRHVIGCPLYVT